MEHPWALALDRTSIRAWPGVHCDRGFGCWQVLRCLGVIHGIDLDQWGAVGKSPGLASAAKLTTHSIVRIRADFRVFRLLALQ